MDEDAPVMALPRGEIELRGRVVHVKALGAGSSWAALVLAAASEAELVAVGGGLARYAQLGRRLRMTGRWRRHPAHGLQLLVSSAIPEHAVASEKDALSMLRSAPHLGAKRAQLLLDHYCPAVLVRVDEDPRRAFLVIGMPASHSALASRWWQRVRPAG